MVFNHSFQFEPLILILKDIKSFEPKVDFIMNNYESLLNHFGNEFKYIALDCNC